jgi:hypothetical protein
MHALFLVLHLLRGSPSSADVAGLQRTDPTDLTADSALEHLTAATIAGAFTGTDPNLLLSLAWHESRYQANAIGPESNHRVSCGPMTPEPVAHCTSSSLLAGYIAGARHLRTWLDAMHGNEREALLGYSGGYAFRRKCHAGPVIAHRAGRDVDLCTVVEIFEWRAEWIRRERRKTSTES